MVKSVIDRSKIMISGYDDLFGGSAGGNCDAQIREILLSEIHSFKKHPFKVRDDEDMKRLVESVHENGILVPAMARKNKNGGYELISGHRRKRAAEIAGLRSMPVIVREIDDDTATIIMVDSNLQREVILPSEKAFSYKMKLEALKNQGKRNDLGELTCDPREHKLKARDKVAEDAGESAAQVRRYIRLTELIEELLLFVDDGIISLKPAVELSYLNRNEQRALLSVLKKLSVKPSLLQASKIRRLSKEGHCSKDAIYAVLQEEPVKQRKFTIRSEKLSEYFSDNVSDDVIERTIFELLDEWKKNHLEKSCL